MKCIPRFTLILSQWALEFSNSNFHLTLTGIHFHTFYRFSSVVKHREPRNSRFIILSFLKIHRIWRMLISETAVSADFAPSAIADLGRRLESLWAAWLAECGKRLDKRPDTQSKWPKEVSKMPRKVERASWKMRLSSSSSFFLHFPENVTSFSNNSIPSWANVPRSRIKTFRRFWHKINTFSLRWTNLQIRLLEYFISNKSQTQAIYKKKNYSQSVKRNPWTR